MWDLGYFANSVAIRRSSLSQMDPAVIIENRNPLLESVALGHGRDAEEAWQTTRHRLDHAAAGAAVSSAS